jgi:hypothetical protein
VVGREGSDVVFGGLERGSVGTERLHLRALRKRDGGGVLVCERARKCERVCVWGGGGGGYQYECVCASRVHDSASVWYCARTSGVMRYCARMGGVMRGRLRTGGGHDCVWCDARLTRWQSA